MGLTVDLKIRTQLAFEGLEYDEDYHDQAYMLVHSVSITHNLVSMAKAAGIYYQLWRPFEVGAEYAQDLIQPLRDGLEKLKAAPNHYKQYNPANQWGDYNVFVSSVHAYLTACEYYPFAKIFIS